MNNTYKVAIVGGGAAGLSAACELVCGNFLRGSEVVILEGNDRVGKKLLATGNGQGNVTNRNMGKEFYHGDSLFIGEFLQNQKQTDLYDFFYKLGVLLSEGEDGKVYPSSKQANCLLDSLRSFLEFNGVVTQTNFKVISVKQEKDLYKLQSKDKTVYAERVVLSFGGGVAKQFGTDGSSFSLAKDLGYKVTELKPSLVQLKTETEKIKGLKGLKEYAKVTVLDGDKEIKSATGDLLFTDYGVSGSAVFNLSGYAVEAKNSTLKIEFLPDKSKAEAEKIISDKMQLDFIQKQDILSGLINKIIGRAVLKSASGKTPLDIANALKDFRLKVTGTAGLNNAQVTKGGIVTDKIDGKTYQSKIHKGLYIVGEALNVDGDCGGYNLTFAFVSGITAAKNIKENLSI